MHKYILVKKTFHCFFCDKVFCKKNNLTRHERILHGQNLQAQQTADSYDETQVLQHDCGAMDCLCEFCGSMIFLEERPTDKMFNSCCHKGKVKLPTPCDIHGNQLSYPSFLQSLLSDPSNPNYRNFRDNIRSYNSSTSFASMGAQIIQPPNNGPYVFKVHGQAYHRTSHLNYRTENQANLRSFT